MLTVVLIYKSHDNSVDKTELFNGLKLDCANCCMRIKNIIHIHELFFYEEGNIEREHLRDILL